MGPHPAVAAIRHEVRGCLASLPGPPGAAGPQGAAGSRGAAGAGPLGAAGQDPTVVLVACSGGADSLALAAALAFEAPKAGIRAGGITIDHGLQPGSAEQARRTAVALEGMGLRPVLSVTVTVPERAPGPEAGARLARYAALDQAAARAGAWVMLGHTLDDQAETVLLGLARGSGARSLAGMAPVSGRYLRPMLSIRREQTAAACAAQDLEPWQDPHNSDPAFTRVRVRRLMPQLEDALGPGVPEALARTAAMLRADADALDEAAAAAAIRLGGTGAALAGGWPAADLAAQPAALRLRLLRGAALAAGCPAGALSGRQLAGLDAMITDWHGQRWADLPGGVRCQRRYGRLLFTRAGGSGGHPPS